MSTLHVILSIRCWLFLLVEEDFFLSTEKLLSTCQGVDRHVAHGKTQGRIYTILYLKLRY